jgi:hypothetical protein
MIIYLIYAHLSHLRSSISSMLICLIYAHLSHLRSSMLIYAHLILTCRCI